MPKIVGIDLGTTSSRVAVMDSAYPVIIENSEGEGTTPSYVAVTNDGTRLVGELARRYGLGNPERVIFAVKRLMGRRYSDPMVQNLKRFMPFDIVESGNGDAWVKIGDRTYAPAQIAAFILQKMKKTAEAYLGQPVSHAIIAIPAYFNDQQRQSTRDAARIAGLEVVRLQSEPTMAALAYGLHHKDLTQTIVVYDLGGGTFDVSILVIGDGVFEVKSTSGDTFLGGEDFDLRIIQHMADDFKMKHGIDLMSDPIARQRLKQAAETAKIDLSSQEITNVNLPFIYSFEKNTFHFEFGLTRSIFESLIGDLVARTLEVCKVALTDADLKVRDIDQVILVGGSTRIPLIKQELHSFFEKPAYGGLRREDAVALGAAISAGVMDGYVRDVLLLDVIPFSLGIETAGGVFTKVLERNSTIPTKKRLTFSTAEDNQEAVSIIVVQGENELANENKLLAKFDLHGISPAPRGFPQIEVTFDFDMNGIVVVSARELGSKHEKSVTIAVSGGLTNEVLNEMIVDAQHVGISEFSAALPIDFGQHFFKPERTEKDEPDPITVSPKVDVKNSFNRGIPRIFLSYAHEDEKWAKAIIKALSVLTRDGRVVIWSDHHIKTGSEWEDRIFTEIEQSNIAMLLLSNDFLDSKFILERELPAIFAEKERRQLAIIPIVARPCAFELHESLSKFQLFNKPETPFSSLEEWKFEEELLRLTKQMATVAF